MSAVLFALVVRNDLVQVEGEKARARVACDKQHIRATIDRRVVERGHRIPCEHLRAGRHVARPETRNETAKVSVAVLLRHAEDAARVRKPQAVCLAMERARRLLLVDLKTSVTPRSGAGRCNFISA